MADVTEKFLLEDLNARLEQLEIEKHALQQVVIAMLGSMPHDQASSARDRINELVNMISKGGSSESLARLDKQKAVFGNIFLAVK
ncbi:hypothetical protein GJV07_22070 [Enterobacteriaceae bacterium RIT711]|nr:hypothetical protein [Enterobacteriaceae bacterium RIT711]